MTLLQTDFLPNKPETFQALRYMMQDGGLQTGRVRGGDYKVTQHSTPNMTVDVAAGSAWIIGSTTTRQGIYHQVNDGLVNVGNFANSDATNPRLDQVILVVNDSSAGGGSDTPQFAIVEGTPTAGATLDNRSGAVTDPNINTAYRNSWVRWADVLIPALSTSVVNANIRDRGPWAQGFRTTLGPSAADFTPAAGSWAPIFTARRVEVGPNGVIRLIPQLQGWSHAGGGMIRDFLAAYLDGSAAASTSGYIRDALTNSGLSASPLEVSALTVGSHMVNLAVLMQATAGKISTGSWCILEEKLLASWDNT